MFTGLVQKIGQIEAVSGGADAGTVVIGHEPWQDPLLQGESIAVSGACLTVASHNKTTFQCDVLRETLARTTILHKRPGDPVNLERALRPTDRLGGHFVQGHIDDTGTLVGYRSAGRDRVCEILCASELLSQMVVKGSVACDGVSLTISRITGTSFEVHLIPTTMAHTTMGVLGVGDRVNIETDILGKIAGGTGDNAQAGHVDWDLLRRSGFLGG